MPGCPGCGGPLEPWRSVRSSEPADRRRFELSRCPRCGSARTGGEPEPEAHETGAYRPEPPRLARIAAPILSLFDRQRLHLLAGQTPPGRRLLDAGAGRGRFVAAAVAAGWDARGIEPSRRGVLAARERGADVEQAGIEDARVPPGSLDAITLWHVLEHVEDPDAALGRLGGWLAPGGLLLIGAPNLGSLQAGIGGERWFHLDVPRHRSHFSADGLEEALTRHGLEVLAVHHILAEHNPFGMWQTVVSRLTEHPSYLYNLLKHNAPARSRDLPISLAALALAPVAVVLELVAGLARRGGTIAVVARRS